MAYVNIYFSLGSNLGDREGNILEALRRMDDAFGVHYTALSKLIETKPMGFSGGKFLNAAVLYRVPMHRLLSDASVDTERIEGPGIVLGKIKEIERSMGRTDPPEYDADGRRIYHSRIIDIDILFYGREIIDTPELTIPHKYIASRPFVLIPLREIARPSLINAFPDIFNY